MCSPIYDRKVFCLKLFLYFIVLYFQHFSVFVYVSVPFALPPQPTDSTTVQHLSALEALSMIAECSDCASIAVLSASSKCSVSPLKLFVVCVRRCLSGSYSADTLRSFISYTHFPVFPVFILFHIYLK